MCELSLSGVYGALSGQCVCEALSGCRVSSAVWAVCVKLCHGGVRGAGHFGHLSFNTTVCVEVAARR